MPASAIFIGLGVKAGSFLFLTADQNDVILIQISKRRTKPIVAP